MKDDEQRLLAACVRLFVTAGNCRPRQTRWDQIGEELGIHAKRTNYLIHKWVSKGWLDYGVSARTGWFLPAGIEAGQKAQQALEAGAKVPKPSLGTILDELEAAEREATPGPWTADDEPSCDEGATQQWVARLWEDGRVPTLGAWVNATVPCERLTQSRKDAAFVAKARNATPVLLARVRELEAVLAEGIRLTCQHRDAEQADMALDHHRDDSDGEGCDLCEWAEKADAMVTRKAGA